MDRVEQLLSEGEAARRSGNRQQAEQLFREATVHAPDNVTAWLALADTVTGLVEKQDYYGKALQLDPHNARAQAGLAWVDQQYQQALLEGRDGRVMYCVNHPTVETLLRCNRCNKPICFQCAVRTPVGYRCRECVANQQRIFFTGTARDYPVAAGVGFVVAAVAGLLFALLSPGFFGVFIAFLVGPAVGGGLAEVIRRAVQRRRSRHLGLVAAVSVALGAILGPGLLSAIAAIQRGAPTTTLLLAPLVGLWRLDLLLLVVLAVATVYARLR